VGVNTADNPAGARAVLCNFDQHGTVLSPAKLIRFGTGGGGAYIWRTGADGGAEPEHCRGIMDFKLPTGALVLSAGAWGVPAQKAGIARKRRTLITSLWQASQWEGVECSARFLLSEDRNGVATPVGSCCAAHAGWKFSLIPGDAVRAKWNSRRRKVPPAYSHAKRKCVLV